MTIKAFIGIAVGGLALAFGMIACSGGGAPTTVDVIVTQEVTVEVTRVVPTTVIDEIHVEVPVTRELEVTREVQVPVTRELEVPVTREVYVTQEVPVEVIREVEVTVEVGEVTRVIEQTVEVTREIEVTREVEVGEVTRVVEVTVPVEVTREVQVRVEVPWTPTPRPNLANTECADAGDRTQLRDAIDDGIKMDYQSSMNRLARDDANETLSQKYRDWAKSTYCLSRRYDETEQQRLVCEAIWGLAIGYIHEVQTQPTRGYITPSFRILADHLVEMHRLIRDIGGRCTEITQGFRNWTTPKP